MEETRQEAEIWKRRPPAMVCGFYFDSFFPMLKSWVAQTGVVSIDLQLLYDGERVLPIHVRSGAMSVCYEPLGNSFVPAIFVQRIKLVYCIY